LRFRVLNRPQTGEFIENLLDRALCLRPFSHLKIAAFAQELVLRGRGAGKPRWIGSSRERLPGAKQKAGFGNSVCASGYTKFFWLEPYS